MLAYYNDKLIPLRQLQRGFKERLEEFKSYKKAIQQAEYQGSDVSDPENIVKYVAARDLILNNRANK